MQFLYRLLPTRIEMVTIGSTLEEKAIVDEHFAYLETLTERGVMILVGRTQNNDEDTFGIVIFQVDSEASAQQIMNDDPAVKKGIMRAKLYPFHVALAGDLS